jgi:hypothetical protein
VARALVADQVDLVARAQVVVRVVLAVLAVLAVRVAVRVAVQARVVAQVDSAARLGGQSAVAVATKTSCSHSISSSPTVPLQFLTARSLSSVECRLKSSRRN